MEKSIRNLWPAFLILGVVLGGVPAHAEINCTGTLTAKKSSTVSSLTPASLGETNRLTAYAVSNDGAGFTFIVDVQGDELVLKIVPDDEKPILKHRFKRSDANVEVPLGKDLSARLSCVG